MADEEPMEELSEQLPQTSHAELEDGIFQLTIALWQVYSSMVGPDEARERTAAYLEKLTSALRTYKETPHA